MTSLQLCLLFVYPSAALKVIDMKDLTVSDRRVVVLAAVLAAAIGSLPGVAQVKTNVPDVVAGAPPAIVERITIHGTALEGNLEEMRSRQRAGRPREVDGQRAARAHRSVRCR